MSTGASLNRHRSKQDYSTPEDFMLAVRIKFSQPDWDLAASAGNAKAENYLTVERNSLLVNWRELSGLKWLNPPFDNIAPWASKCARSESQILFLVPASIGSNWFADYVHNRAMVWALNPRLSFDGKNPYPKDCMLCAYGFGRGFGVWKWK